MDIFDDAGRKERYTPPPVVEVPMGSGSAAAPGPTEHRSQVTDGSDKAPLDTFLTSKAGSQKKGTKFGGSSF